MEIEFGETTGEQLATLMVIVSGLHRDIHGNGQPGLKQKAEQFMSEHIGAQAEQQRQHDSNTRKLNALIVIGTLMIALMAVASFVATIELTKHAQLDPAKIFHSANDLPTMANRNYELSTIPNMR